MLRWITCGVKEWWYPIPIYDRYNWFWAARPRSAWRTSRSVRPGGRARGGGSRISSGTTASMNASSDSYPSVASMLRVSSGLGPMWRVTKRSAGASEARTVGMTLLPDVFLVRLTVQQLLELRGVFHAELDHPARPVGVAIHEGRIALERGVHVGHGAPEGRVQLRHGLHGLDRAEHVAPPEDGADLGQVHVHHVPELALRVVGDPDLHDGVGAGLLHVLVLCCVAQIGRNVRHAGSLARGRGRSRRRLPGAPNRCQGNGLAVGNRSDRGASPVASGSTRSNRPAPQGRRSRRTATGSGSAERDVSTPRRPPRVHACCAAGAAAAVATIASGGAGRPSAFSTAAASPVTRRTASPASA